MKKTLLSLSIFALAACGGGTTEDKPNLFSGGDGDGIGNIVGVWDATENLGNDGIDERYFVIDKSGLVIDYDYAGDSYDQEGNCYWIDSEEIRSLGNNLYEITPLEVDVDEEPEEPEVFKITRKGDKLTIGPGDPKDPDRSSVTFTKSTKSVSDLTPECPGADRVRAQNKVERGINMHPQR